jgi:acetyl esterase/lipase
VSREDRSILTRPAPPPDAVLSYGPDAHAVADFRSGGSRAVRRPLLVIVHGGFWRTDYDRAHIQPMAAALAESGWSNVVPEYRRIPGEPDAAVTDVRAAVRALPGAPGVAGHFDGRVVLIGHSAGGHLVLQAAAAEQVDGALALAPVADLRLGEDLKLDGDAVRAFLGEPAAGRPDLDPARLPAAECRIGLVHGREDDVVPLSLSESYWARHRRTQLFPVDGGHFGLIDPRSNTWPDVLAALESIIAT